MKANRCIACIAGVVLASLLAVTTVTVGQQTPSCTIFVQPGESIQAAIDRAPDGAVICLSEGTWKENIAIEKSLTLRGQGAEKTVINGVKEGYPVVWITSSDKATQTRIAGLTISEAKGGCTDTDKGICAYGMLIQGRAQVTISSCTISENGEGIDLWDSARAEVSDSIISRNEGIGIRVKGSSQADITSSTVSGNLFGIGLEESAKARITRSTIFENTWVGIWLWESVQAEITGSTISENHDGIQLRGSAQAKITASTISGNRWVGIMLWDETRAIIEENEIINNVGYGVALRQWPCFFTFKVFSGHVSGRANTIPGPAEPDGNGKGAVCPSELNFLMSEQGGELDCQN